MNELTTLESPLLFKIIIVGDTGVGKTCFLHQYTHNEFKSEYNVTIGVEFSSKIIPLDSNTTAKLQIWDTVILSEPPFLMNLLGWTRKLPVNHKVLLQEGLRSLADVQCL